MLGHSGNMTFYLLSLILRKRGLPYVSGFLSFFLYFFLIPYISVLRKRRWLVICKIVTTTILRYSLGNRFTPLTTFEYITKIMYTDFLAFTLLLSEIITTMNLVEKASILQWWLLLTGERYYVRSRYHVNNLQICYPYRHCTLNCC